MQKQRNVDKIKELVQENTALKYEMGRNLKKIESQRLEIASMRKDRMARDGAMREINGVVDAICITIAQSYGTQTAPGEWELPLPEIRTRELLDGFTLTAEKKDGAVVLHVTQKATVDADDKN